MPDQRTDGSYSLAGGKDTSETGIVEGKWWLSFDDISLNRLMDIALAENLSVQQGYSRLKQAMQLEKQAGAELYPPISGTYDYSERKESGADSNRSSEVELVISWEVDLWGRLEHAKKAAEFAADAAENNLYDIALLISFEVAESYFALAETVLERQLLENQIRINKAFLQLTELRFANGAASVVDVYQQRQLLTSKKADIFTVDERAVVLQNRLHVLIGRIPGTSAISVGESLPQLPGLPGIGIPADLLQNRPDLSKLQDELQASQHRVAEAIADRLPHLRIGAGTGFADPDFFYRFFADAFAVIIDYGKQKSEVERKRAVVEELSAYFAEAYLRAVEEVENSLWREKHRLGLLQMLEIQQQLAQNTLRESRSRYMQGLSDYLPVLAALQTFQNLERDYLQLKLRLVTNRLNLYKALGGSVLDPDQVSSVFSTDTTIPQDSVQ